MQRLLNAVTAFSLAIYVVPPFAPLPAMAEGTTASTTTAPVVVPEGAFTIELDGQTVICLPDKVVVCPDGAFCVISRGKDGCLTKAKAKVLADAAAPTPTETVIPKEAPASEAAPAAGSAPAVVEAPAPVEAPVPGETTAASEPAAKGADATVTADAGTPTLAPADQTTVDQTTPAQTTPAQTTADSTAPAAGDATGTMAADTGATAAMAPLQTIKVRGKEVICLPLDMSVICPEGAICVRPKSADRCEVAAIKKLDLLAVAAAEDKAAAKAAKAASDAAVKAAEAAGTPLVDAPKPTEEAVKTLDATIAAPAEVATTDTAAPAAPEVAAAAAADAAVANDGKSPADATPSPDAVVTEQKVTAADTRTSAQEFAAAPATTADGTKKTGLSDLERAGLVALGALVIGQMLYGNNGSTNEVVSNSGDRVVVKDAAGNYQVYKDDDVLLRQPGSSVRTETFSDGSTRTTVKRNDGTSVVTIRDASGRVLRRSAYNAKGIETALINDTIPETHVNVSKLPKASANAGQDAATANTYAHQFSLRQIRTIPEVKALAKLIPVNNVRFETGSSAILPGQAQNLADLGKALRALIKKNPGKVFLIEGHTDAVGNAPYNLTLSDRRAESVAKALSEYYGVPPENLVVQGYGESELLVDTQGAEVRNRRVAVRDVTALLRQAKKT